MNVEQLRRAIVGLPDDMPVLIAGECGADDNPSLYVIPARIERNVYGSHVYEDHRSPSERRDKLDAASGRSYENCSALLFSQWGNDAGLDITPRTDRPTIIDGKLAPKTLAEQLDAAESGEQFGQVLSNLFGALDKLRQDDEADNS
ncbi:hypothetical protein I5G67_gp042 [Mycobacterium phage Aminay]|uniref:Uncharacterized protein n=1 Tax=Mycobacterium phage Aminay TaxID=2250291 RepID=A0A345KV28_9CAUD|nr:hypothetical protein I5G67_gp042 [Mycobacterium phage Aminay]AXH46880.1 hypothetical protein SEA_AMINAY_42 [Mycobacterium phage Aminay]